MTTSPPASFGFGPGQTLLVTGAGSGIGRALAIRASQMGLRVSAWDINPDGVSETVASIRQDGGIAEAVVADVSDPDAIDAGFRATRQAFGVIDYLVNNACPAATAPLEFDDAMRISIGSVRRMTDEWASAGLPATAATVATSSVAGNKIGTGSAWYCASKAAVMGYTRHLATYRADEFRANAIGPGMVDTPRLTGFAASEIGQRSLDRNPLKRMATPDDIAYAALFLLSPLASYINGVFLPVDGGWTVTQ